MATISKIGTGEFTIEFWMAIDHPKFCGLFSTLNPGNVIAPEEYASQAAAGNSLKNTDKMADLSTYSNSAVGGFALGLVCDWYQYKISPRGETIFGPTPNNVPNGLEQPNSRYVFNYNEDDFIRLVWLDGTAMPSTYLNSNGRGLTTQTEFLNAGNDPSNNLHQHRGLGDIKETDIFGVNSSPQAWHDTVKHNPIYLGTQTAIANLNGYDRKADHDNWHKTIDKKPIYGRARYSAPTNFTVKELNSFYSQRNLGKELSAAAIAAGLKDPRTINSTAVGYLSPKRHFPENFVLASNLAYDYYPQTGPKNAHIAVTRQNNVVVPATNFFGNAIQQGEPYSTQIGKTLDCITFFINGYAVERIYIPKDTNYTVDKDEFILGDFFDRYERSTYVQEQNHSFIGSMDLVTVYDHAHRTAIGNAKGYAFDPPTNPASAPVIGGNPVTLAAATTSSSSAVINTNTPSTPTAVSPRNTNSQSTRYRSLIVYKNLQGQPVTGVGPIILPDPTIDECYVNDCCNHYVQTGTRSETKTPQRYLSSGNVVIEEPSVPFHTNKNFVSGSLADGFEVPNHVSHSNVDLSKTLLYLDSDQPDGSDAFINQSTIGGRITSTAGDGGVLTKHSSENSIISDTSIKFTNNYLLVDGANDAGVSFPQLMNDVPSFTLEFWFYIDADATGPGWEPLINIGQGADGSAVMDITWQFDTQQISVHRTEGASFAGHRCTSLLPKDQWHHIAVTKERILGSADTPEGPQLANRYCIFANGKKENTWTTHHRVRYERHETSHIGGLAWSARSPFTALNGFMDHIVIHRGDKPFYTEDFTPLKKTTTIGSTASLSVNQSSAYFESGYLTTEISKGFNYSDTGKNFTVEFWANFDSHNTGLGINNIPLFSFVNDQKHQLGVGYRIGDTNRNERTLMFYENNSGIEHTGFNYTGWLTDTGKWYHISVVRDDDGYKAFQGEYGGNTTPTGGTGVQYGDTISLDSLTGHWPTGECRFILGGLVSGTFTGNNNDYTQEFSNDAHTVLLSNFNETISDESSNSFAYTMRSGVYTDSLGNEPTFAVISGLDGITGKNDLTYPLEPKQGTGFLIVNPGEKNPGNYLDGQNNHDLDSYAFVQSTGFNFGTGDFSVECWTKPRGGYQTLGSKVQPTNKESVIWSIGDFGSAWKTGNGIALTYNNFFDQDELSLSFGSNLGINKFSIAKNTDMRFGWLGAEYENELPWHHIMVQRLSGNFECYLNGILFETVTTKDLTEHALTKYSITSAPDINNPNQKFFLGGMNQGEKIYSYPSDKTIDVGSPSYSAGTFMSESGTGPAFNPFTGIYSFPVATGRQNMSGLADSKYIHDSGIIDYGYYQYRPGYQNFYGKSVFDWNFDTNSYVYEPVRFYGARDTGVEQGFYTFKIPVTGVGPNDTNTVEVEAKFASWQPMGVGTCLGLGQNNHISWNKSPILMETRDSHSHKIEYGVNALDQTESWSMPSRMKSEYKTIFIGPVYGQPVGGSRGGLSNVPNDSMFVLDVPSSPIQYTPPDQKQYTATDPKITNFKKTFTVRSGDNILLRYYKDGGVPLVGFGKHLITKENYTSHAGVKVPRGTKLTNELQLPNVIANKYFSQSSWTDTFNKNGAYMYCDHQDYTRWASTERCEPLSIKVKLGSSDITSYHGYIDSLRVSKVARFSDYVDTGAFSGYLDSDIENVYIDELRVSNSGRYTGEYYTTGFFNTDVKTELLCHFNEFSGVIDFFDEHCGKTGKYTHPLSGRVGDVVGTYGKALYDVTGIEVGDTRVNAVEWNVISQDYLCFKIPVGAESGPYYIMSNQYGEVTGCDLSLEVADFDVLDFSPKTGHVGQEVSISGNSLHLATSVSLSGDNSARLFPTFTKVENTGINFVIPPASITSKITVSANRLGTAESDQTDEELVVIRTGISLMDTTSGTYDQIINLSGLNLDGATQSVFFEGYTTGERNLVAPLATTFIGTTGLQVKVPREIVKGPVILSGNEAFTETLRDFTPLPTISGIHNNELIVGQPFRLSGINATNIAAVLGFSGNSDQPYYEGNNIIDFISNPSVIVDIDESEDPLQKERTYRFGSIGVDTTQIEASAPNSYQTGFTIVTGLINSVVNGTGFPFLVSLNDTVSGNLLTSDFVTTFGDGIKAEALSLHFSQGSGITHSLLSNVTGDKVVISGVEPEIRGIDPSRGNQNTQITITGTNFYNLTGVRLTDIPSETSECFIESGDFVPQTGEYYTINTAGQRIGIPYTGFHILNLGETGELFTIKNSNEFGHSITFKICDSFITSAVDQAYIYGMNHTGTTGQLTIPS